MSSAPQLAPPAPSPGAVESRLEGVLSSVVDWIKYEEAKNGALLTLDGVGAGIILQFLSNGSKTPSAVAPWLKAISLAALFVSMLIALSSFWPIVTSKRLHHRAINRRKRRVDAGRLSNPNVLFFDHIAGMCKNTYLRAFRIAVRENPEESTPLELAYADEIVNNSEIAVLKLRFFKIGVAFAYLGFIAAWIAAFVNLLH